MAIIKALVVWGWGWGWQWNWGWGWGWWLIYNPALLISDWVYSVTVWEWWIGWYWWASTLWNPWWDWDNSVFYSLTAIWWWGGWAYNASFYAPWRNWWCGWWGWVNDTWDWVAWIWSQWYNGWTGQIWPPYSWWWWWWMWWNWAGWNTSTWWIWLQYSISWTATYYSWWGWGWGNTASWVGWLWWGWAWAAGTANATDWVPNTGWWWWWGWVTDTTWLAWKGWKWIVIISYATDWSDWVNAETTYWWIKTISGTQTIHTFNESWTFTLSSTIDNNKSLWEYLGAWSSTTKLLLHLDWNANDSSWNWNNWTPTNITWVGGKLGSWSTSFNRSSWSNILLPNFNLNSSDWWPWTFSCWFKTPSWWQASFWNIIFNKRTGNNTFCLLLPNGSVNLSVNDWSATATTINGLNNVVDNKWHSVVVTSTSYTNASLYVDWVLQGTSNSFNFVTQSFYNMIWNFDWWWRGWLWEIDEVICEARAWSANEVRKYYTFSQWKFIL